MKRSSLPARFRRGLSCVRIRFVASTVIAAAIIASSCAGFAADAPGVLPDLRARLAHQSKRFDEMETLRSSYSTAKNEGGIRQSHELTVRLEGPIQVVSEKHAENDGVLQKDYFLHESEVYALRVWHWVPSPDGKTARVSENRFFFDKGAPIFRGGVVARVPVSAREPDLSKAKETAMPLPSGAEKWGERLKSRAFAIARSFRPHVGQYVFGSWDQWLLKGVPEDDPGLVAEERTEDWLPPKETRVMPIKDTDSPDGLFKIGWGYPKGPVDWASLAYGGTPESGDRFFSTKMATGLKPPLSEDSNFLINAITDEPVSDIGLVHPGERQRFNHDEILVHWSPSTNCFIVQETEKWGDQSVEVGWIKEGKCEKMFNALAPLIAATEDAVKKSNHPAAKRVKREEGEYSFGVWRVLVEDDGRIEARVTGQVPKDDQPSGYFAALVSGTLLPGSGDGPAVLKNAKVRILPAKAE